jgi:hypothetical protein
MEIDPKYADCICRRFQEYTGNLALGGLRGCWWQRQNAVSPRRIFG